ncbi:MAG: hypothetical protein IKA32_03745, partial [Lentisphaeria bacterium]|nr:hypothetical protein [Lentisphaeria bacterium]
TLGKVDVLRGFKENVITGHLIPAGTGSSKFQNLGLKKLGEEIEPEEPLIPAAKPRTMSSYTEELDKDIEKIFGDDKDFEDEEFMADLSVEDDEEMFAEEYDEEVEDFEDELDDSEFDPSRNYDEE